MITSLVPLLLVSTLTLTPAAGQPAPLLQPVGPGGASRERGPDLADNVGVPALQLLTAETVVLGSLYIADRIDSGPAWALALVTPVTVPLATCAVGRLSRRHRGSCWHAAAGSALGILSGVLVYALFEAAPSTNPVKRGQDDTQSFTNGMSSLAFIALVGIPVGSVIGWNAGKQRVPDDGAAAAAAPLALSRAGGGRPALVVPLLAGTF